MFSESSSSAFIQSGPISNKWSEITLLQVRSRNALYTGIRHGRKFLIKAIKPVYGDAVASPYATQSKVSHEKEFRLGILLNHPHIMSTYSLEEVEDLGLCIVAEWIEGVTLGKWLLTKPSLAARRRVLMQILDALAYIHSLQLVHHDIKLDNIMITTNGSNVKLIDFGLSNTDDTVFTESNDVRKDIVGVGKLMGRMFPHRYPLIKRRCMQGAYAHIGALRKAILRRSQLVKWLYALLLVVLVLLCAALISQRAEEKVKQQEIQEVVKNQVDIELQKMYDAINSTTTFMDATSALTTINTFAIRDSLVNLYADDPASAIYAGSVWDQYFTTAYNQLLQELSTNRTKWPYPEY